jgi:hypothetical protein
VPTHHVGGIPARHDHRVKLDGGDGVGLDIDCDRIAVLGVV